jgi:hypothetical protein
LLQFEDFEPVLSSAISPARCEFTPRDVQKEEPTMLITAPTTSELPGDKFDLESLRLSQNFAESAGVKKLLTTVPVRKPNQQDFVRVHPSAAYRMDFPVIELKDEREDYIIRGPELVGELAGEFVPKTIYTAMNRQNVVFLWPVRLPDPDGRQIEWHRSMREAAEIGMERWVRVRANMALGGYEMFVANKNAMAEPTWPEATFQELVKLAFRDRLIDTIDHPVIKRLRGIA